MIATPGVIKQINSKANKNFLNTTTTRHILLPCFNKNVKLIVKFSKTQEHFISLYIFHISNNDATKPANKMDKRRILTSSRFFNKYCVAFSLTVGRR